MLGLVGKEKRRIKIRKKTLIGLALVCVVAIFFVRMNINRENQSGQSFITAADFEKEVFGQEKALGESDEKIRDALSSSENFNVTQLSVNGGVGFSDALIDFENSGLLVINNIKSELYSIKDGDKDEVRAIVSCQTNKKTVVEIEYFKSGEKVPKLIKGDYFGLNHVVIIPSLEPDSVYRYSIKARDPIGNIANSDQFVFYIGAPNISLMDVLSNATQKVFGWAMKK